MRSESKGVKNKAYRKINGFPLFYYTLSVAQKSKIFDKIVISTDSEKIARMCKKYNANIFFLRSKKLSKDNTPKIAVTKNAHIVKGNLLKDIPCVRKLIIVTI